jgi:glutamyl-tRNA synthetase
MADYDGQMLVFKKSTKQATLKGLQNTVDSIQNTEDKDWHAQELQMKLGLVVERNSLTNGDVFWPVRVALSGEEKSPSPVELLVALGKEESLNRLRKAIRKL